MTLARTLTATAVALALAPVAPVIAQDAETAPEAEAATDVSDAKLDAFVLAALDVSEIAQSYQSRMQAAEDDAARQALQAEARAAMRSAVEDADGITLDEYVSISEAARDDEALNQRVMNRLSEQAPQE